MSKARQPKRPPHDSAVILFDAGKSMSHKSDIEKCIDIGKWITSRKIFSGTPDEISLVTCGTDEASNNLDLPSISVLFDEFKPASFDDIRFIQRELKASADKNSNLLNGLIVSLDLLKQEESKPEVEGKMIVMITNGKCNEKYPDKDVSNVIGTLKNMGVDLVVIGVDDDLKNGNREAATSSEHLIQKLVNDVEADLFTFDEALNGFGNFTHVSKAKRAAPFILEISKSIQIPVKSFVKAKYNTKSYKVKYVMPESAEPLTRERVFIHTQENKGANATQRDEDDDEFKEEKEGNGLQIRALDKSETTKGYMFGKTRLIIGEDEYREYGPFGNHMFNNQKCLQVVQLARKEDIPPGSLIGKDTRIFAIDEKKTDERARSAFVSFVKTVHEERSVVIVRYAYNKAASPSVLALFPFQEDGYWMFSGIRLAFYEDIRVFNFPSLSDSASKPSTHQLRLIDDLIDGMQLRPEDGTDIDPSQIMNPSYQRVCTAATLRAIDPSSSIDSEELMSESFLQKALRPQKRLLDRVKRTVEEMTDPDRGFELVSRRKEKRIKLEVVPENIDDLLEQIDRIKEEEEEIEQKKEIRPSAKLSFQEKALGMKTAKDFMTLRMSIEAVLDAADGDAMFFPRVLQMLGHMRKGALSAGQVVAWNELLSETRDGYWQFAEWIREQDGANVANPISTNENGMSDLSVEEAEVFWKEEVKEFKK